MPLTEKNLTYDVNLEPWRCQHVIDKIGVAVFVYVAPVVADLAQLVLADVRISVDHRVHVAV